MSKGHKQDVRHEAALHEEWARIAAETDRFEAYERAHATRIAKLVDELAKLFHLPFLDRASLRIAALLHDVGEAAMNRSYIRRAGPLTEDERLDLARHPVIGEQEAARLEVDVGAQLIIRWHHEWWNGTGYPDGLCRSEIPLPARILRVADAYAALTETRPYRSALSADEARRHLAKMSGIEFDPEVVTAFLGLEISLD
jgi:HD-GYP domain-containing protein (c-di-GMP phosphodiesterase class II)